MVLRKERSTPLEGNSSSSTTLTSSASSSSSSSRIMSNEQPVSKRQRIDNRNLIGVRVDGGGRDEFISSSGTSKTTTSTTAVTTISNLPSISSLSSSSSSSSSLKDDQEIPPDILVRPLTSSSLTSNSGVCLQSSSSLQCAVSVCHNNLNENHHNCSSSSINSSLSSNSSSQDEVDRVTLSGNHHQHHNSSEIPDLLRLSNGNSGLRSNSTITTTTIINCNNKNDVKEFEEYLMKQCLCNIDERILRKSFLNYYFGATIQQQQQQHHQHHQQQQTTSATTTPTILHLYELPTNKLIQFLSNLQLLFDIYLKQNQKGFICSRIMEICNAIIHNDVDLHHHHHHNHYHHNYSSYDHHFSQQHHHYHHNHHHNNSLYNFNYNLIDEIIELNNYHNKYVQFLSIKVLSSFLVITKTQMIDNWLKKLVDNLFVFDDTQNLTHNTVKKINFSLEIIKRIVEWKDIDIHPLDDDDDNDNNDNDDDIDGNGGVSGDNDDILRNAGISLQQQQPLLENNYFAIHYNSEIQASSSSSSGLPSASTSSGNGMNLLLSSNNNTNLKNNRLKKRQMIEQNDNIIGCGSGTSGTSSLSSLNNNHNFNSNNIGGVSGVSGGSIIQSSDNNVCHLITLTDSESFDTTQLKCLTIKILENKWPALVKNMSTLIQTYEQIDNSENCILTFLLLWENIISVKANLSIIETLPFYSQLDKFEILLLNSNLSCIIYKQMLNLFNESLCYGSTLALQDLLPEETCQLAHQIVRHVKDYRILDSLPKRKIENCISFIGYRGKIINYNYNNYHFNYNRILDNDLIDEIDDNDDDHHHNNSDDDDDDDDCSDNIEKNTIISTTSSSSSSYDLDKTILQKMVLLILKSIAVTVKEIRSDSSDSSIDSQDYDAFQDMILIERSIRDVLKKLELFIKQQLEFHPECHFSKILIHLFDDQDDYLIESMVCTLDVTSGISFRNNAFPELVAILNPIYTFLEFLKMISNSTDLLLDLLVSNETCFLLYLLRFLKYIRLNWSMFVASCHEFNGSGSGSSYRLPYLQHHQQQQIMGMMASSSSSAAGATGSGILTGGNGGLGMSGIGTTNTTLDDAMSVLIRLRLQISRLVSKSLYPYDISPVLRLLESCESLYEGNELS